MKLDISHRKVTGSSDLQCTIVVRWYAVCGTLFMEFVGYGPTQEDAEKSARLLLGQARAKLNEVTAKETAA